MVCNINVSSEISHCDDVTTRFSGKVSTVDIELSTCMCASPTNNQDDDGAVLDPELAPPLRTNTTTEKNQAILLAYCFCGIMTTFSINGVVLEKLMRRHDMGEMSITFVTSSFCTVFAYILKLMTKERPSTLPWQKYFTLALLAFGSATASLVALRYVTFITRILGKSCKSIPVMLLGVCTGKRYPAKKYVSVSLLSLGVAIFLVGTTPQNHHHDRHTVTNEDVLLGAVLLLISLVFDGATGALEDKYIHKYNVRAFELMSYLSAFKALFAAVGMVTLAEETPTLLHQDLASWGHLMLLSFTGAIGQAYIFYTIDKFGALTTSIIGTFRKVASIGLSVLYFQHNLQHAQFVGLTLAFVALGLNWNRPCRSSAVPLYGIAIVMEPEEGRLLADVCIDDVQDTTYDCETLKLSLTVDREEVAAAVSAWDNVTAVLAA